MSLNKARFLMIIVLLFFVFVLTACGENEYAEQEIVLEGVASAEIILSNEDIISEQSREMLAIRTTHMLGLDVEDVTISERCLCDNLIFREVVEFLNPAGQYTWGVYFAGEPGVLVNDFPGEPLFGDDISEGMLVVFESGYIRRFIEDIIHTPFGCLEFASNQNVHTWGVYFPSEPIAGFCYCGEIYKEIVEFINPIN